MTGPRVRPYGTNAVLVEFADGAAARAAATAWLSDRPAGVGDVVPGDRTVLLTAAGASDLATLRRIATTAPTVPTSAPAGPLVEVPTDYDGPDLAEVALLTGLTADGVVAAHTGADWTVAFVGFAPGFGYLVGGDPRLVVPRRATPRTRVPAGAVALAGRYSGIYPTSSPGGWQLIGRTALRTWDLDREPPGRLTPGARIRFVVR